MLLKPLFVFCFLFLFYNTCFAQTLKITGTIKDNNGEAISAASVQLKNAENNILLVYDITGNNGAYTILTKAALVKKMYLVVSSLGYKRDTLLLHDFKGWALKKDFILLNDTKQLAEISIKAPKPIIEEVNDTTKYNVKDFTSPEDRNLESVIKKMPGMEVSTDGTIYFKKKRISKVLVENDDLTGENYKAITQNLNPNLVDEVQAIENWVEDDLLKGIINSDDIVLNLTLKDKRKQKIIGGADIDYGTDNRRDLSTNLIGFIGKTKAFGFIRNNNVGSSQENGFQLAGQNRKLPFSGKLIDHKILAFNPFDGETMALNNSLNGSLNAITHFSTAFKINTSIYGLRNKLYGENSNTNIFYQPINVITATQQNQKSNNQLFQADVNTDYLVAKNARFTAKLSYKFRPQLFTALASSSYNGSTSDEVNQEQKDRLKNYNADLKYTLKASNSSAIVLSAKLSQDNTSQNYNPTTDIYNDVPLFNDATSLLQTANINHSLFKIDAQGLKKTGKSYLYINIGTEYSNTTINSNLYNAAKNKAIDGFLNDGYFKNSKAYLVGKYSHKSDRVAFYTLLKISLINQAIFNTENTFFALEPELGLSKKIGDRQSLNFNYSYRNTFANPLNYYNNLILTDIRNVNSGISTLYNFGTHSFNLAYSNNKFSDKYFSFNANTGFQCNDGSLLTNNFFENTIYYSQLVPYKSSKSLNAGLGLQKFFPAVASKLSLNYNPSLSEYFGQVGTTINSYTSFTHVLSTKVGTGFKLPVNFSLEFQYQNNATNLAKEKINSQDAYKYSFQSRFNISKTLYNLVDFSWYKISGQNYRLLNLQLQYTPNKGIFKYAIYGKNIFNVTSINNTYVSNVGESRSSASILGRYFLASVSISIR